MATAKQRLYEFINAQGLTIHAFEKKCGLSNGNITHARPELSTTTITKVKAVFPNLNTTWLICGEGSMYIGDTTYNVDLSSGKHDSHDTYTANGENAVAGKNVHVQADNSLQKENEELRKQLSAANAKIAELQDELLAMYRERVSK